MTPEQSDQSASGEEWSGSSARIPVVEETATVQLRASDTGGVRLTRAVDETVRTVRAERVREEVRIDRTPGSPELLRAAPTTREEDGVLVVPIVEEVLVVERRYRVTEEVRVVRSRATVRECFAVPVRVEHITVEPLEPLDPSPAQERP